MVEPLQHRALEPDAPPPDESLFTADSHLAGRLQLPARHELKAHRDVLIQRIDSNGDRPVVPKLDVVGTASREGLPARRRVGLTPRREPFSERSLEAHLEIGGDCTIVLPVGAAISPKTGTGWETVGVVPNVETSPDATLEELIEMVRARIR